MCIQRPQSGVEFLSKVCGHLHILTVLCGKENYMTYTLEFVLFCFASSHSPPPPQCAEGRASIDCLLFGGRVSLCSPSWPQPSGFQTTTLPHRQLLYILKKVIDPNPLFLPQFSELKTEWLARSLTHSCSPSPHTHTHVRKTDAPPTPKLV